MYLYNVFIKVYRLFAPLTVKRKSIVMSRPLEQHDNSLAAHLAALNIK